MNSIINDLASLSGAPQSSDELPIERGTTTYKVTYQNLLSQFISNASAGNFDSLQAAAAAIWGDMADGTVRIGKFTRTGAGNYAFWAFRSSDTAATMLCMTYIGTMRQVTKQSGTVTEYTYTRETAT